MLDSELDAACRCQAFDCPICAVGTCDKCGKYLDYKNGCIEYGNGESGYTCVDCYSSLADNYMMEDR